MEMLPTGMLWDTGGPASPPFLLQRWENRGDSSAGWQGCVSPGKGPPVFVYRRVPGTGHDLLAKGAGFVV